MAVLPVKVGWGTRAWVAIQREGASLSADHLLDTIDAYASTAAGAAKRCRGDSSDESRPGTPSCPLRQRG